MYCRICAGRRVLYSVCDAWHAPKALRKAERENCCVNTAFGDKAPILALGPLPACRWPNGRSSMQPQATFESYSSQRPHKPPPHTTHRTKRAPTGLSRTTIDQSGSRAREAARGVTALARCKISRRVVGQHEATACAAVGTPAARNAAVSGREAPAGREAASQVSANQRATGGLPRS